MANNYFTRTVFIPYTIAESRQVNEFNGNVDTAFDKLPPPLSTGKGFSKNFEVTETPTLNEHVVRVEEAQSNSLSYAVDTTGTGNTYTITLPVAPSSYQDGLTVKFRALKTNTTTAYLNVNGLGNVEIIQADGSNLTGSEIKQDYITEVIYNNGRFQLISQTSSAIAEAPTDGDYYARRNASWQSVDSTLNNGSYAYDRAKNTAVFNLVSDPNFSKTVAGSDLTYWNQAGANIEWDGTQGFDGSACMKFTSNGTNLYADSQAQAVVIYTPALDTDNFYLRFRAKKDASFNGTVELRLSLFDASYSLLSYSVLSVASGDLTTNYSMITGIATLSETTTAFISVAVGIPNSSTTGVAYVDDVLVSRAINWDDGLVVGSNKPSDNADVTYDETAGRGANVANARYSSFEERELPPLTVSNKNTSLDTAFGFFGDTSYKFTTTSTSNYTYFGESDTDYNIKLTPNKTWIISAYIYSDTLVDVTIGVKTSNSTVNITDSITSINTWQRVNGRINLNVDAATEGVIKLSCNSGSATINADAIMLEEAVGGQSTPSSYVDPAMYAGATYTQGEYIYDRGYETAGFNLITDPTFNKSNTDSSLSRYWETNGGVSLSTTSGVDNSPCVIFPPTYSHISTRSNYSTLYVPAVHGEKFYMRCRAKKSTGYDGLLRMFIQVLDKNKNYLTNLYTDILASQLTTSYDTYDSVFTISSTNSAFIKLGYVMSRDGSSGNLYVDDVFISRAIDWDTSVVAGSKKPEDYATKGATWDDDINNQPDDIIITNIVTLRDTFERDPANTTNVWESYNGSGELSSGTGSAGGKSLKIGDNSGNDQRWLICNQNIPYDTSMLYEIGITIKRTAGTGTCYVGVAGVAADGTTLVNRNGGNSYGSQHYITLTNSNVASSFTTYKGYIKGTDSSGSGTTHSDPKSPGVLHEDAKYIRGLILVNYGSVAGTHEIDEFWIRPILLSENSVKINGSVNNAGEVVDVYGNIRMNNGQDVEFYTGDAAAGSGKIGGVYADSSYGVAVSSNSKITLISADNIIIEPGTGNETIVHEDMRPYNNYCYLGTNSYPWQYIYGNMLHIGQTAYSHDGNITNTLQVGGATTLNGTTHINASTITHTVYPSSSSYTCGTSSYRWGYVYTTKLNVSDDATISDALTVGGLATLNGTTYLQTTYIQASCVSHSIYPSSNNSYSCGTSSLKWNNMYTQNLNVTVDLTVGDDITVDDTLTVGGYSYLNSTATTRSIRPNSDGSYYCGSSSRKWSYVYTADLYVTDDASITDDLTVGGQINTTLIDSNSTSSLYIRNNSSTRIAVYNGGVTIYGNFTNTNGDVYLGGSSNNFTFHYYSGGSWHTYQAYITP